MTNTMPEISASPPRRWGTGAYVTVGTLIIAALCGSVGFWAATTEISGAVVAPALVVVDTHIKKVQHLTGGIVAQITVKEGDAVKVGDLLIRLDETVSRANLQLIIRQLDEMAVRQARMRAELKGADEVSFPDTLTSRSGDSHIAQIILTELELFQSRRSGRLGQKQQLAKRITQLEDEIRGLTAEHKATERELTLAQAELAGLAKLEDRELVNMTKITASRRLAAQVEGDVAQVAAKIAQARGRIAEIDLQIMQVDEDMRSEVGKELRDTQAKVAELSERQIAAEDQLRRMELRAPQNGVVHQLAVHTVGGVVAPTEPVMLIVPNADRLVFDAKIPPHSIDQISIGQAARIRLSAFDQRTTPEFDAVVTRISADLTVDGQSAGGQSGTGHSAGAPAYYVSRIELTEQARQNLSDMHLVPGMPAEVFIKTQDRTALTYLLKPVSDQFERAFRER